MKPMFLSKYAPPLLVGMMVITSQSAHAQSEAEETVRLCLEAISELSGGSPPDEAVRFCEAGEVEQAINVAATGG